STFRTSQPPRHTLFPYTTLFRSKQHQREAEIVAEAGKPGTVTIATNMAGRGTDIKLTPESRAAGGLAIIGTERHESRRVDRQLRSEEHTSELQSHLNVVCGLLLE